jgi:hypothetical protein
VPSSNISGNMHFRSSPFQGILFRDQVGWAQSSFKLGLNELFFVQYFSVLACQRSLMNSYLWSLYSCLFSPLFLCNLPTFSVRIRSMSVIPLQYGLVQHNH